MPRIASVDWTLKIWIEGFAKMCNHDDKKGRLICGWPDVWLVLFRIQFLRSVVLESFGRILESSLSVEFPRLSVSRALRELGFLREQSLFVCASSQAMIVIEEALILSDTLLSWRNFGNLFGNYFNVLFFSISAKPIRAGHHPGVANPAVSFATFWLNSCIVDLY